MCDLQRFWFNIISKNGQRVHLLRKKITKNAYREYGLGALDGCVERDGETLLPNIGAQTETGSTTVRSDEQKVYNRSKHHGPTRIKPG